MWMLVYMLSGPAPPWYPPPPFPVPGPRPRAAPAPGGRGQPERTHANQSEGGRWRMIPASASSQERRTASEQGQGAPFARRKEQHHTLYGNEHVTMTLLLTSGSNHTCLCRTHCPTQAGRGQPKRPQAPLHRGKGTRHVTMTLLTSGSNHTIPL